MKNWMRKSLTKCRPTGGECLECYVTENEREDQGEGVGPTRTALIRPALGGGGTWAIEEGTGGRRNTNAMLDVQSYEAGQDKE